MEYLSDMIKCFLDSTWKCCNNGQWNACQTWSNDSLVTESGGEQNMMLFYLLLWCVFNLSIDAATEIGMHWILLYKGIKTSLLQVPFFLWKFQTNTSWLNLVQIGNGLSYVSFIAYNRLLLVFSIGVAAIGIWWLIVC